MLGAEPPCGASDPVLAIRLLKGEQRRAIAIVVSVFAIVATLAELLVVTYALLIGPLVG